MTQRVAAEQSVVVETGARLHFGLLAVHPPRPDSCSPVDSATTHTAVDFPNSNSHQSTSSPTCPDADQTPAPLPDRHFGGMGVMVQHPGFRLRFAISDRDQVHGPHPETVARTTQFLERVRCAISHANPEQAADCHPVAIQIEREMGAHRGLGSGTQLGLAVARGLQTLWQQPPTNSVALASQTGRGRRSAIGVHGFDLGGMIVEAGQRQPGEISPLVSRLPFPADWRWVLVSPADRTGLSGTSELQAFDTLPPMPAATTATLCRILLMDWIPAISAADFQTASRALWEYGQLVGRYFAPAQGGVFASRRMEQLADELRAAGHLGIAQTSWGPTLALLCPDESAAEALSSRCRQAIPSADLDLTLTAARNAPATVTTGSNTP